MKDLDESTQMREEIVFLSSKLAHLNMVTMRDYQQLTYAQIACHGERPKGIWSAIHKERKPQDLIPQLIIPNSYPLQYKRNSKRMVELVRKYHKKLLDNTEEENQDMPRQDQIRSA